MTSVATIDAEEHDWRQSHPIIGKIIGGGGLGGKLEPALFIMYNNKITHIHDVQIVLRCVARYLLGIGPFLLLK
jgi:hypothetical protein